MKLIRESKSRRSLLGTNEQTNMGYPKESWTAERLAILRACHVGLSSLDNQSFVQDDHIHMLLSSSWLIHSFSSFFQLAPGGCHPFYSGASRTTRKWQFHPNPRTISSFIGNRPIILRLASIRVTWSFERQQASWNMSCFFSFKNGQHSIQRQSNP